MRNIGNRLTVEAIKEQVNKGNPAHIKYVRVESGFRYADVDGPLEHRHLIQDGEKAISAGFFSLFGDDFVMSDSKSFSLDLGPKEEDKQLLEKIFLQ